MDIKEQLELIKRGAVEIISEKELLDKLHKSQRENKPLKIKAGFDPSAPDIHLGHAVLLKKLRDFQDAGHIVYFLIGDFTGRIGDPTGQSATRRQLTKAEVIENAKTYEKQVFKILDRSRTQIVFNSQWFDRMSLVDILRLISHSTVAQMLARADFKDRFEKNVDISILEFMYPLLQAYDSVVLEADVEIGGTDQKFNILKGRELQKDCAQPQQVVLMMPLLVGTDGVNKMSKSLGNYIGINEPAKDIFGKIMSISDATMLTYYELLTNVPLADIEKMKREAKEGRANPKDFKLKLGEITVEQYYNKEEAKRAKEEFEKIFQKRDPFTGLAAKDLKVNTPEALLLINFLSNIQTHQLISLSEERSKSEFRRLVTQGAITVDGKKITDINYKLEANKEHCITIGKRDFIKVILRLK